MTPVLTHTELILLAVLTLVAAVARRLHGEDRAPSQWWKAVRAGRVRQYLAGNWWAPRACSWPFADGFCTYNAGRKMSLEFGLTREEAQAICDELNGLAPRRGAGN